MAKLDARGHEVLDDTPVSIPAKFRRIESLSDQIRRVIREEMSLVADAKGFETFEEADDFDVEDDEYNPYSPHELSLDQELEGYGEVGSDDQGRGGKTGFREERPTGRNNASGEEVLGDGEGNQGQEKDAGKGEKPAD